MDVLDMQHSTGFHSLPVYTSPLIRPFSRHAAHAARVIDEWHSMHAQSYTIWILAKCVSDIDYMHKAYIHP